MIPRMKSHVLAAATFFVLMLSYQAGKAQDPVFEVYGPVDVVGCSFGNNFYGIETSAELVNTTWSLIPSTGSVIPDTYSAEIEFFSPGTYLLVVSSLTVDQEFLTDTLTIYVFGSTERPEVIGCYEFESDSLGGKCYQVCAFSQTIIQYPGGSTNIQWEVTGAESYTNNGFGSIEITWGAGGDGSVTLISQGCETVLCFKILPQPVADFNTDPPYINDTLTVCKLQDIFFENNSVNGLDYLWSFGDGHQSISYDATHAFANEGYYTVTLAANSICGCTDEKQIVVEVLPAPAPMLDCVNSICPETRQHYTVTPAGCSNYTWSISGNGTIVNGGGPTDDFIDVIWHEGPDGYIYLSVSGCATSYCSFTNTFRIPIISPEGPVEGDASVCSGEIATYTAPYFPGTQYFWNVGPNGSILGGQNTNGVTIQWANVNSTTSSTVEVYYNNCFLDCFGHDVMNISITPEIHLNGDIQVCADGSASVSAEAGFGGFSPANVAWHIEDENGQVIYTAPGLSSTLVHNFNYPPGLYTWVATNTNPAYCTEEARLDIAVTAIPAMPLAIHGEQRICPGQLYGYTIESAGDYATTWFITDGSSLITYDGQSCQHAFGPAPPYIVLAYHTDIQYGACASDPISLVLDGVENISIQGPDEVCYNAIDSFSTDYISGADYTWQVIPSDHGEIRKSNLNEVSVFWTQSGNATLRLSICGTVVDKNILVHAPPSFNITGPLSACANGLVNIATNQPLLGHVWSDENQNTISIANAVALPPGTFAVEVTDGMGCTNEKTFTITTLPAPEVLLSTPYDPYFCVNIPGGVEIVANTDGAGYMFEWFIDDLPVGPGGPIYNVTTFGAHHVEVTNQYGCSAVSEKITFLNCCDPVSCGFGVPGLPGGCVLAPLDFQIVKNETECQIKDYVPGHPDFLAGSATWYVYNNSEGLLDIVTSDVLNYTYEKPGYYHIILRALLDGFGYDMTTCGHAGKIVDTIRAVADFEFTGKCAGLPVTFEDLTTFLPAETIASWSWDFGDPASAGANTSALQDPSHLFNAAGAYEVTLTVTMASGCITTRKYMVDISDGPALAPVYEPFYCEDEAMSFILSGDIYDIEWNFGDPASGIENISFTDSVYHTYNLPGQYFIQVNGKDIYGCQSTTNFNIDVTANTLSGLIDVVPLAPPCAGDTATLTAPAGGVSWLWSTDETTTSIEVTASNQYGVLITDQFHCTYTPPPVFITVNPTPVVIIQAREIIGAGEYGPWTSSLELCYGEEFELFAFSTGNVTYEWYDGSNTQSIQFINEAANLPGVGTHEYTVITTDLSTTCVSDTATIIVEIFDLPVVPVISLTSGPACSFSPNTLQVTNPQPGVNYIWSDGQEGTSITTELAGAYNVTAVNANGCTSLSNTITIQPSAPVDQIPGGCFVECDPLEVCLPPIQNVSSYSIYQNGIEISSGTNWPGNYTITDDGSYTIEVITTNGCVAVSDPLDVMLYTGVGSITVETWYDQDGDLMIGPGDVLLPGITVEITSDDGQYTGKTETVPDGWFVFVDYPAQGYLSLIDRTLLPSQYRVIIDSVHTQINTCEDSVVVQLLLGQNCTVTGPDYLAELCEGDSLSIGDSTWTSAGTYTMHMNSVAGCDSMFQVIISNPDSFNITASVWVDVDHDGMISPSDTLASGIVINIAELPSGFTTQLTTDASGVVTVDVPVAMYAVAIDTMLLSNSFAAIIFETTVPDTVCGSIAFEFLIESLCAPTFVIYNESICSGDSLLFDGQWISDAGQYTFVHSDPVTLCDTVIDLFVTVYPPAIVTGTVTWNCNTQGTIDLDIVGMAPYIIQWNTGATDTLLTDLAPGDYAVTVTDANGCSTTGSFAVTSNSPLSFDIPSGYDVAIGDSVLITIEGDIQEPGLIYSWQPASILTCSTCPESWAFPANTTTVQIQITDSSGCVYLLETVLLLYQDSSDLVYAPNVFSPNQDGINDYWRMFSKQETTFVYDLMIFDRWGTLILARENFTLDTWQGWDGTFKGQPYNPGVFTFISSLRLADGKEIKLKGDITLVR